MIFGICSNNDYVYHHNRGSYDTSSYDDVYHVYDNMFMMYGFV